MRSVSFPDGVLSGQASRSAAYSLSCFEDVLPRLNNCCSRLLEDRKIPVLQHGRGHTRLRLLPGQTDDL